MERGDTIGFMGKPPTRTGVDLRSKLPERLSPSRAKDFAQCPKLFYYKTILKMRTPATVATCKGTLAHYAFEKIFDLEPTERTPENAVPLVRTHWETLLREENYREIVESGEEAVEAMLVEAEQLVRNWFAIENPTKFEPEGREQWVRGKVATAPMHGVIDRLDKIEVDGVTYWCISDYKGLGLDTVMPTPSGWTTMGEIGVGDEVFSATGEVAQVLFKSEEYLRECYEIRFSDGSSIVADNVHDWQVEIGRDGDYREVVCSTEEMYKAWAEDLLEVSIRATKPIRGEFLEEAGPLQLEKWGERTGGPQGDPLWWLGKWTRASASQRREALLAVLTSSGTLGEDGERMRIVTTSERSASWVAEIIASLGGIGRVIGKGDDDRWIVVGRINGVLESHDDREADDSVDRSALYHRVVGITTTESVPTACIEVDSEDHLFLVGKAMIATHNTGKVPNPRWIEDSFFGMNVYAALLEDEIGVRAELLRLVFVKNGSKDDVFKQKVTDESLTKIKGTMKSIWADIQKSARKGEFPTKTSKLCGWCHFQDICPAFHPELEGLAEEEIKLKEELGVLEG